MSGAASGAPTGVCSQCGAPFRCGMEGGDAECWCASLPAVLPLPAQVAVGDAAASCLCPSCLRARLALAGEIDPPP